MLKMSTSNYRTRSCYWCCFSFFIILCFSLISAVSASRSTSFLASDDVGPSRIALPSAATIANGSVVMSSHSLEENDQGIEEECEENYGFLPCSKTAPTNLFLIMVYGYLIFVAATCLSKGSDLLSEILGVGVIGGFFLPLLGSLPDALLILVSGLFGSLATAQDKLSVGMGLLAGATVVRLTVIWGACVVAGKHNLENSEAIDEIDTKGLDLLGSGVTTDLWTCYSTRIMVISVLPFLVVQFPQAFSSSSTTSKYSVLIAFIISSLMLLSYGLYQVFQPWIQRRRIDYVKHKRVMTGFLQHLKKHAFGRLCNPDGSLNNDIVEKLFTRIDVDNDNHLCKGELKGFIIGMQFEGLSVDEEDIVDKVMEEFDTERQDDKIDLEEFKIGITHLLKHVKGHHHRSHQGETKKYLDKYDEEAKLEHLLLGDEEAGEEVEKDLKTTIKAVLYLVLGTVILAVFAEPLVDAFRNFSGATGIPMFFLSFIALPIATNSGEAVSAILFSSRKTTRSASLTLSEIHGMVTVNNLLCLSVFLALVYIRGLAWDFSSEVLITFLVCIIMGGLTSFRTTFPLWTAALAFLLYPVSLVLVYVLDYVFGWS